MALLDLLLNRKNLTYDWIPNPNLRLVVDLDRHALCGVSLGEPIAKLSGLGPCDDPRAPGGLFEYGRRGFYVTHDAGMLDVIVISLVSGGHRCRPYAGTWRYHGRDIALSSDVSTNQLRELLGEPFHDFLDTTGERVVLRKCRGGVAVHVRFGKANQPRNQRIA